MLNWPMSSPQMIEDVGFLGGLLRLAPASIVTASTIPAAATILLAVLVLIACSFRVRLA